MSTEETLSILVADLAEYIKRSLKMEHNFCTTHLVRNMLRKQTFDSELVDSLGSKKSFLHVYSKDHRLPSKGPSFHSSLEECNTVGYICLCSNSDSLSFR